MNPNFFTKNLPNNFDEMVLDMLNCEQTAGQTVYQHGLSVWKHMLQLIESMKGNYALDEHIWRIPDWFIVYQKQILDYLPDEAQMHLYALYHDCGKPYCRKINEETGQVHFPNHAEVSAYVWNLIEGKEKVGFWIANDMEIHTSSAAVIDEKLASQWTKEDSICLLLASLAEIHSNAKMFGGIDSTSFKIKWKTVNKRGNQILKHWFKT